MGALSVLVLAAAAAAPASDAFRFDGPSAFAWVEGGAAVTQVGGEALPGKGSAFLRGEDRVRGREMTYGDAGELWLRATAGGDVYRVELDAVGFPPDEALPASRRSWWRRAPERPPRPEPSLEGGVVLGRAAGQGGRAAMDLWGIGRLYLNDQLIAPRARIQVQAIPAAAGAAPGAKLDVSVDHLPQGGTIHFALNGATLSEPQAVASRGVGGSGAAGKDEDRAAQPRPLMTIDEQWESGMPMLAWRESPPAQTAATPPASAPGAAPAQTSGAGTPPAAVPPTPNTAPIQYEAGQNGPYIGTGMIGGGAAAGVPAGGPGYGGLPAGTALAPGTGIFAQGAPPPSGLFAGTGSTPSAPTNGTPGAPALGTPGAPAFSTPTFGTPSAAAGTGAAGLTGQAFASPGIPATPQVLNNSTTLPSTPQPLNAQPAPAPGAGGVRR